MHNILALDIPTILEVLAVYFTPKIIIFGIAARHLKAQTTFHCIRESLKYTTHRDIFFNIVANSPHLNLNIEIPSPNHFSFLSSVIITVIFSSIF